MKQIMKECEISMEIDDAAFKEEFGCSLLKTISIFKPNCKDWLHLSSVCQ